MNERLQRVLRRAEQIATEDAPRRRAELIGRASAAGHPIEYGDLIYDIAEEEGIDPAIAFELVLNGIGIRELSPPSNDGWLETQVEAPPQWVSEPAASAVDAAHERHMRTTFRRLRSLLEQHGSMGAALAAFAQQPDVAEMKY